MNQNEILTDISKYKFYLLNALVIICIFIIFSLHNNMLGLSKENKVLKKDLKEKIKELDTQIKKNKEQEKFYNDSILVIKKDIDLRDKEINNLYITLDKIKIYYDFKVKVASTLSPDSTVSVLRRYLSKKNSH